MTAPGEDYALPIDAVTETRITLRPDRKYILRYTVTLLNSRKEGFGYKWSRPMQWEDLIEQPSLVVVCPHSQPNEQAWRLQAWAQHDVNDPGNR